MNAIPPPLSTDEEEDLELVPDIFRATLITGIIQATRPLATVETSAGEAQRAAAIIAMFNGYDPDNTIEAMTASHCVTLHFQLRDAMMSVPDAAADEKTARQLWSRIRFLSGALRGWLKELKTLQKNRPEEAEPVVPNAEKSRPLAPMPPPRSNGHPPHQAPRTEPPSWPAS